MLSQNLADRMVEQALAGQRRRVTGLDRMILVLRGLAALLIIPLLAVVLDHQFSAGLPRRAIASAGILWGLLILAGLVALRVRAARRHPRRLFLARDLEETYAIRHNLLVNAVQIQADQSIAYAEDVASRQTAAALQTATLVRPAGPLIRRAAVPLAIVLVAWLLYGALGPKSIWPSLARFFGFGLAAPTATSLQWIRPTADEDLYLDRPLEIVVATSGRPVETVRLERFDSFETPPVFACALQPGMGNARPQLWRVTLAPHELTARFRYRITAGDASLQGELELQEPVQLTGWEVELRPPAYTGAPSRTVRGTEVLAWEGTRAVFHLRANAPIMDPLFVLETEDGENRTRMQIDFDDPRHATFPQQLNDSGTFRAVFRDALGRAALPGPPGRLTVRVDQPPVVAILKPSRDDVTTRVDVSVIPRVLIHAADDIGLADVSYVLERDGRATRERLSSGTQRSFELDWSLSELDVAIGEEVRLWFEARDRRVLPDGTPSPQNARSRALILTRSPPLEPQPGAGGSDSEPQPGEGAAETRQGPGDAVGQVIADPTGGEGDGNSDSGQGASDGPGTGAGETPGAGAGQPGREGEGPAAGGADPTGSGPPSLGDGSRPGDGVPDIEGPGGFGTDNDAGDFDRQLRDFAEKFGPQAKAVQEQAGQPETGAPDPADEGTSEPATDDGLPEPDKNEDPASEGDPASEQGDAPGSETDPADPSPAPAPGDPPPGEAAAEPDNAPAGTTPPPSGSEPSGNEPPGSDPGAPTPPQPAEAGDSPADPSGSGQDPAGEGGGDQPRQQSEGGGDLPDEALEAVREMLVADDPLTPDDLAAAGLSATEAAAFLEAYERLRAGARSARVIGPGGEWESGPLNPVGEIGPGGLSTGARLEVGQGDAVEDRLRRIVAPSDERAPVALEAVLDAYYRAMGELDPQRVANPDLTD